MAKVGFVSEAGAHGFHFESPGSTHFSVTVVLVEEENKREVEEGFGRLRERYFPGGVISFPAGNNGILQRREFIAELKKLNFSFHALLVDKRKLHQKSPLQYKGTFYKFLSGLIYNNLYRTVPHLSIVANELGTPEFMESFRRYILENHQVDLFSPATFTFSTGEEAVLLELAGFLGESLNLFHTGLSELDVEQELSEKCVGVICWPEGYVPYTVDTEGMVADAQDEAITAAAQLRARDYLQRHAGSEDPVIKSRMVFVEYLLMVFTYNYRTRFIHTYELLQHLNSYKYENYTEHRFRSLVVGPVRDEGVLIVSSSAGYKLPCSTRDIYNFFNYYNQQIQPMLHRLGQCHQALELATEGGLDVLKMPEYAGLKKLMAKHS
ncbi:P-loop NTPase family protein [Pontibacter sp. CAU 1760]